MFITICPSCSSEVECESIDHGVSCSSCGGSISAEVVSSSARPADDAVEDSLAADLRMAFGLGSGSPGSAAGGDEPGSNGTSVLATDLPWTRTDVQSGARLADFEVIEEIGRGGMGVVYRARQRSLGREVALKLLPHFARHGRTSIQRFRNEALAAAKLNHANVVPVFAQGEYEGHYYYAMKLVEGVSLDTVIKAHPRLLTRTHASEVSSVWQSSRSRAGGSSITGGDAPERSLITGKAVSDSQAAGAIPAALIDVPTRQPEAPARVTRRLEDYRFIARLLAGVADGLSHAHQAGIVHRDVKPHNLIYGLDQKLYLTDFGLAHMSNTPALTVSGEVMGTPCYLAPEQARGDSGAVDARTDVFSFGATLYEAITGVRAFDGETRDDVLHAVCEREPIAPRFIDANIPRDLETICVRALQKAPGDRYQTCEEVANDLRRFADGLPIVARRIGLIERSIKWASRHKALTGAMTACVLFVFAVAWGTYHRSASRAEKAARQAEQAQALVTDAYEKLVHVDKNAVESVAPLVKEAESLGARGPRLSLVRAMIALANEDYETAEQESSDAVKLAPEDPEYRYLLSWVLREERRGSESATEAAGDAEELGEPDWPEAWFFRGLALHRKDTEAAIESYRKARDLSVASGDYFPQAELELARAHNQLMYRTRRIESFNEAELTLRSLAKGGHYGAKPHELLSIGHRFAGDHYAALGDPLSAEIADEHFESSLRWAQQGQQIDPNDVRPVMAEAHTCERIGDLDAAIEAWNRVAPNATRRRDRCETYHFRWRLYAWAGEFAEARADVEAHLECAPKNQFYSHVYPAILDLLEGDPDGGAERIGEMLTLEHINSLDVQLLLEAASVYRVLGALEAADELLDTPPELVDFSFELYPPATRQWREARWDHARGLMDISDLEAIAAETEESWKLLGQAYFQEGAIAFAEGDRGRAIDYWTRAHRTFRGEWGTTYLAKLLVGLIERDLLAVGT